MSKPAILSVDDDASVSQAISRDLRARYGEEYRIVRATSGAEAMDVLEQLAKRDSPVALIVSDHRMPEMTGIELLARSRGPAPDAKLVLLTAYADTEVAIRAINDVGLDHYLMKPWDPPEERLYPVIDDLLSDWQRQNRGRFADVRVIGHRWAQDAFEAKNFLARNHVPYRWLDIDRDPDAATTLARIDAGDGRLTTVLLPDGSVLRSPSNRELADALGIHTRVDSALYDLVVVGAGPAGLAAAVYGASEGLKTVVVERESPGGQAGQSARIENYLGFPTGLSGLDLSHRAVTQARRLGAEMVLAQDVCGLTQNGPVHAVQLADGSSIEARSVIVATGVSYVLLDAPGVAELTGRGVYYGASAAEARNTQGDDVYLVGAANSAGQAALNLAAFARRVVMLVRGDSLEKSMSQYLVDRIHAAENIEVRLESEVAAGTGADHLESLTIRHRPSGAEQVVDANWLFAFIGATPRTEWLDDVERDSRGFVLTGQEVDPARWPLQRQPFLLETSHPGVFAAGDVRLASMKRVASAVGEGAMAVSFVHRYLETV